MAVFKKAFIYSRSSRIFMSQATAGSSTVTFSRASLYNKYTMNNTGIFSARGNAK